MTLFIKEVYERHEQVPLEAIQVEILRRSVACKKQYQFMVPKGFEQPLEYHGICNVQDLELVYAEEIYVFAEVVAHCCDCVL